MEKVRTVITQDAEVDDQNSLRHFLFYANEVELLGIVQTSSKFHWIGVPGAVRTEQPDGGILNGRSRRRLTGRTAGRERSGCIRLWTITRRIIRTCADMQKAIRIRSI